MFSRRMQVHVGAFKIPQVLFGIVAAAHIPFLAVIYSQQIAGFSFATMAAITGVLTALAALAYHKKGMVPGVFLGSIASAILFAHFLPTSAWLIVDLTIGALLIQVAVADYLQPNHSLERALPVVAHIRRFCELIREEIRQYFLEDDDAGRPASRLERNEVYRLSKGLPNEIGLGSVVDYSKEGRVIIPPSAFPVPDREKILFAPIVMGRDLPHPAYLHGRFGVGDMSFGSLGSAAVQALSSGAKFGLKYLEQPGSNREIRGLMSTGEGGLADYHLDGVHMDNTRMRRFAWRTATVFSKFSSRWRPEALPRVGYLGCGDIMWEIGTGNFGCSHADGSFNEELFLQKAADARVVAIKWKHSQGAKPGCGAILPGSKVTEEIARVRSRPVGVECVSPNTRPEWPNVPSMVEFIRDKRKKTGKPQLIKFAVGDIPFLRELFAYLKEHPNAIDGIHLDGGEGGTGAAPQSVADRVGMSIEHAIPLVENLLREYDIRDQIVLISSGKGFTPGQVYTQLCKGSDYVMGARGQMLALGCIQSGKCDKGECVVGITTHHPWLQRALNPMVKYRRVALYMEGMHKELARFVRIRGKRDTLELNRDDIMINGKFAPIAGSVAFPYPEGKAQQRQAPTPAAFGLPEFYDPRVHATIAEAMQGTAPEREQHA